MRRNDKATTTWAGRMIRGLLPDRNPLRRGSDRVETALLILLLAGFAAAAPFTWHAASSWASDSARNEAATQRATLRQVTAVLLQDAAQTTSYGYPGLTMPQAMARWTIPGGRTVTGLIPVPDASLRAGNSTPVWVDQAGNLSERPLRPSQISGRGQIAAATAMVLLLLVTACAGLFGRWALDRHRLASWSAEWRAAGPQWTSRR